ncbi:SH3 domain-containing protein [uncultured Cohaesibacter sp.]|uniref:SH3 domain-containing protein n=1 Tax=uncultured Cohaesibacter sp. TaxID=1002546 RepID=UPI00292F4EE5|nr:SH3 domain-containing protein [uncultured Cohaesibacter sp.]
MRKKQSTGRLVRISRTMSASLLLLASIFVVSPDSQAAQFETLTGIDLPGGDMFDLRATDGFKNITLEACQKACNDRDVCKAYTWNRRNGWCFLKVFVAGQSPHQDAISAIKRQHLDAAPQLNSGSSSLDAYGNAQTAGNSSDIVTAISSGNDSGNGTTLSPIHPEGRGQSYLVTNTRLNARSGPGGEFDIVAKLGSGDPLTEIERRGDWSHVTLENGTEAWVHNGYIAKPFDMAVFHSTAPDLQDPLSDFMPQKGYSIRPRISLEQTARQIIFDDKNDLIWMESNYDVRAFAMSGSTLVAQSMKPAEVKRIFGENSNREHALLVNTRIRKSDNGWVVEDQGKEIFSFDFKGQEVDKALFATYLKLAPAALAYAYYDSGLIRIWDVANKVLVAQIRPPSNYFANNIGTQGTNNRFIPLFEIDQSRKLSKSETALLRDILRKTWADNNFDRDETFKKLGITKSGAVRLLDILTGVITVEMHPAEGNTEFSPKYAERVVVNGQQLMLTIESRSKKTTDKWINLEALEVRDYQTGKLHWSITNNAGGLQSWGETIIHKLPVWYIDHDNDLIILAKPVLSSMPEDEQEAARKSLQIRQLTTGTIIKEISIDPLLVVDGTGALNSRFKLVDNGTKLAISGIKGEAMLVDLEDGKPLWMAQGRAFTETDVESQMVFEPDWELDKSFLQDLIGGATPDKIVRAGYRRPPDSQKAFHMRNDRSGLEIVYRLKNESMIATINVVDFRQGKTLFTDTRTENGPIWGYVLTPDGEHLLRQWHNGDTTQFQILKARTGEIILKKSFKGRFSTFHGIRDLSENYFDMNKTEGDGSVAFSPNGQWIFIACASEGEKWFMYDVFRKKAFTMSPRSFEKLSGIDFGRYGRYLMLPYVDGQMELVDMKKLKRSTIKPPKEGMGDYYSRNYLTSSDGTRAVQFAYPDVYLWDLDSKKVISHFALSESERTDENECWASLEGASPDGQFAAFGVCEKSKKKGQIRNMQTGEIVSEMAFLPTRFSEDNKLVYAALDFNHVQIARTSDGRKMAEIIVHDDGSWIVLTPEGFFNASEGGGKKLDIINGTQSLTIDQAYDVLFRPDLVKEALAGDPNSNVLNAGRKLDLAAVLDTGLPPQIIAVTSKAGLETNSKEIEIDVTLQKRSGGLGRIDIRVNGSLQNKCEGDSGACRGLGAAVQTPSSIEGLVSRKVVLKPGTNLIEVSAYDKSNHIASDTYKLKVEGTFAETETSDLYILAIGVDDYYDSALKLDYAIADANGIIEGFSKAGAGYFDEVHVTRVFNADATRKGIAAAFETLARNAKTTDVFLFYIAGHGKSQEGHYYFLPQDFVDKGQGSIEEQGVGREQWRDWFSQILASKSVLVYDTCESGSLVSNQSRSLTNRAAADRLMRATGRSTLAATSEKGVALEGIGGHGVFTFTLLEGLSEADSDNDSYVELTELTGYVQKRLPELSHEYFGYRQLPETQVVNSFPLGRKTASLVQSSDLFIPSTSTHVVIMAVDVLEEANDGAVKEKLKPGTLVRMLEDRNGWAKIARNGKLLGFVPANSIVVQQ